MQNFGLYSKKCLDHVETHLLVYRIMTSDRAAPLEDIKTTTAVYRGVEVYYSGEGLRREIDLKRIVRIETTGPRQNGGMAIIRLRGEPRPGQTVPTLPMQIAFIGSNSHGSPLDQAREMAAAFHTLCPNAVMN